MSVCVQDFQTVGVGLLGSSLSGSFSFVFDTGNFNSFIEYIAYNPNSYDTDSASISAFFQVSNYQCDFDFSQYTQIGGKNHYDVWQDNVSGRYVKMHFFMERDSITAISPRVYDADLEFAYDKTEYDYKMIYKLKNDIYGFEYALLKEDQDLDVYNYKFVDGEVLFKTLEDKVIPLEETLPSAFAQYNNTPMLYSQMTSGVYDIEVFYDTLMFVTSNYIVFEKLVYSFENNQLATDPTNLNILNLSALSSTYCDVWFFESDNVVLTFLMDENTFYPKVYKHDLLNNNFSELDVDNTVSLDELSSLSITRLEKPVLTFDNYRKKFNVGALIFDAQDNFNILSIDLDYDLEKLTVDTHKVISSVDYENV